MLMRKYGALQGFSIMSGSFTVINAAQFISKLYYLIWGDILSLEPP
jgi:hypothetical protein